VPPTFDENPRKGSEPFRAREKKGSEKKKGEERKIETFRCPKETISQGGFS